MALWTPNDLAVGPRLWTRHREAVWSGSNLSSILHQGTDTTNGRAPTSIEGVVKGTALGGFDGLNFPDGWQRLPFSLASIAAGGLTVVSLFQIPTDVSNHGLLNGPSGWDQFGDVGIYADVGGLGMFSCGNGWDGANAPRLTSASYNVPTARPVCQVVRMGSGVNKHRSDGANVTLSALNNGATPGYAAGTWRVGTVDGSGEGLHGVLFEQLLLPYAASDAEIEQLEGWAYWLYGVETYLDAGHPYKSAAPTTGSGPDVVTATGIKADPTTGQPAVGQKHALTATGIKADPTTGQPAVGVPGLAATGIVSLAPTVGQPAVGQRHALTATGLAAAPSAGQSSLVADGVIAATGLEATPSVGQPTVGQKHALTATGLAAPAVLGAPLAFQGIFTADPEFTVFVPQETSIVVAPAVLQGATVAAEIRASNITPEGNTAVVGG